MSLQNFLMSVKVVRRIDRICSAVMYADSNFCIAAVVFLGCPRGIAERIAGTALFFLIVGLLSAAFYFRAE